MIFQLNYFSHERRKFGNYDIKSIPSTIIKIFIFIFMLVKILRKIAAICEVPSVYAQQIFRQ